MNFTIKLLRGTCLMLLLTSVVVYATDKGAVKPLSASAEASAFEKAVKKYKDGKYLDAIGQMDALYWNGGVHYNDALFYIVLSQEKLGSIVDMKRNIGFLKRDLLSAKQLSKVKKLESKYQDWQPPVPKTWFFSLVPYAGQLGYSAKESKKSGQFFGLGLNVSSLVHQISLGYESLSIDYRAASTYGQSQAIASYTGYLNHWLALHGAVLNITTDSSTYKANAGQVLTVGAKTFRAYSWEMGADYEMSSYEDYTYGKLNLSQLAAFGSYSMGTYESTGVLTLRLTYDVITPDIAPSELNKGFSRFHKTHTSLGSTATYAKSLWTVTGGFWTGQRLMAVSDGGVNATNNDGLYTSGFSASVGRAFSQFSLTAATSTGEYKDLTDTAHTIQAITLIGGYSF